MMATKAGRFARSERRSILCRDAARYYAVACDSSLNANTSKVRISELSSLPLRLTVPPSSRSNDNLCRTHTVPRATSSFRPPVASSGRQRHSTHLRSRPQRHQRRDWATSCYRRSSHPALVMCFHLRGGDRFVGVGNDVPSDGEPMHRHHPAQPGHHDRHLAVCVPFVLLW